MQITPETLNILKSFTTINASIYIKAGNVVKTISPQKTILAIAEVGDDFKTPFGIYDLPQFLSTISPRKRPSLVDDLWCLFIKAVPGK